MKHKHYDLIVAWANGAKIQCRDEGSTFWSDIIGEISPTWNEERHYRIKPEPKPDVVLYGMIQKSGKGTGYVHIDPIGASTRQLDTDTCKFIFDGETGKLKSAEVL